MRKPSSVELFVVAEVALALTLLVRADWVVHPTSAPWSVVGTLLLIALLSEAGSYRLRVGTVTSSISFIPYLAAVILVGPAWAMAIAGTTDFLAETLLRRKRALKVIHNTSKEIIAVGCSAYAYLGLGGQPSLTQFDPAIPAFLIAVVVFFPLNQGTTALAIALSTRARLREAWGRVGGNQVYDVASSSMALLLAFLYVQLDFWGPILVVLPLLLVRHSYGMTLRFEQDLREFLVLTVKGIEARDPYTYGHSARVSRFARIMAEELGLSAKHIDQIATAALLHDLGKIYQEFAPILRKEGKLESREVRLLQSHPVKGADLIGNVASLRGHVQQGVLHHHEAFGGRGYPDRLSGQEIPLAARIIAVVDTFDAMTTTRPYRSALSRDAAFAELQSMVGRQFDPTLVDLFCTNERIADVIDEALRERPSPDREVEVATGALIEDDYEAAAKDDAPRPRRWLLRARMEPSPKDLSRQGEKHIA